MNDAFIDKLSAGCKAMGLTAGALPLATYQAYVELLAEWNRAYSLTAVKTPAAMLSKHILDSLSLLPLIDATATRAGRCLDVGSGAGLPGMILALARPDLPWVLLDSNAKKIRFMRHAALTLGVENIEVIRAAVPNYTPDQLFTVIVSRAFAALPTLFLKSHHLLSSKGCLLAMKGANSTVEAAALKTLCEQRAITVSITITPLQVADIDNKRCVISVRKMDDRPTASESDCQQVH